MTAAIWWTDADQAELDVLVHELSVGYFEHREHCAACSPEPCPVLGEWREHLGACKACKGIAPYGPPCERKRGFIDHGRDCVRCNPCPSVSLAVGLVVAWREARELQSRAAWLCAEQIRLEGAA